MRKETVVLRQLKTKQVAKDNSQCDTVAAMPVEEGTFHLLDVPLFVVQDHGSDDTPQREHRLQRGCRLRHLGIEEIRFNVS